MDNQENTQDIFDYSIVIPMALIEMDCFHKTDIKMYALIKGLSRKKGHCFATNAYLGKIMGMCDRVVQKYLQRLKTFGLIEVEVIRKGTQTSRHIWLVDDPRKRQNSETIKEKIKHDLAGSGGDDPGMTGGDDLGMTSIFVNNTTCINNNNNPQPPSLNESQKPKSDPVVVVVSSDSEKVKAMQSIHLSENVIERALRFSLEEIKTAIECCLNAPKSIDNLDGYFMSAIKEKWQPKPNKAKIEAIKEETQQQQQQIRQKIYLEAKQLEVTHKYNLKEAASFSVNENTITIKINGAYAPYPLVEESLKTLKKYIKDNQKDVH